MMFIDSRIPLRFGRLHDRTAGDAVLTDDNAGSETPLARFTPSATGHDVDCTCCSPRSAASVALAALFRERAVSAGPAFNAVLAVVGPAGEAAVRAALATDPLVSARFRLA